METKRLRRGPNGCSMTASPCRRFPNLYQILGVEQQFMLSRKEDNNISWKVANCMQAANKRM
eukprot:11200770-Lingulodinium_polyedra.AAC.1